jgi:uncharacterized protein (TIGR02246 family)
MHTMRVVLLWAFIASGVLQSGLTAAESSEGDNSQTAAVRAAAAEYLAAVRSNDTDKVLRSWTENGDYIDATGRRVKARDLIGKKMAERRMAPRMETVQSALTAIRFITPTVAIEDGTYDSGDVDGDSKSTGRFTAVWVKQNNRWLLDSLREAVSTSPQRDEHLKPLEWLVGDWVGASDDCVMLVSARWSDRGDYIVRELAVIGDRGEATATERIGWDAASEQIKSWAFDSQDGRGEGRWKRDGDRWFVETTDVTADDQTATSSAVITPSGDDEFIWEVKSSKVGDQEVAPRRVKFKRAPDVE